MEAALIVFKQTVIMFLLIVVGYWLYKSKIITEQGSRDLGALLVCVVSPCVIFDSFCTPYSSAKTVQLLCAFAVALLSLVISMAVSWPIYRKRPVDCFGAAFSNCGFMGIPLTVSVLGTSAVIYATPMVALSAMLMWTYGVWLLTGEKGSLGLRQICTNPYIIAIVVGFCVYLSRIPLPPVLLGTIKSIGAMNTPGAMIAVGIFLAHEDLKSLITDPMLYLNALVRLIVVPAVILAVFSFLPDFLLEAKLSIMISSACPVAASIAVYAQLHNRDYNYACKTICMSTVLSIFTIPVVMSVAQHLWM